MEEYVNEAGEVTMGTNFGEAYDKEWALLDQGRREGLEEGMEKGREEERKEIAKKLIDLGIDKEDIFKSTGLTIEEIEKYIDE